VLAALAACRSIPDSKQVDLPPHPICGSGVSMPRANIGPDVNLRVLCGTMAAAGVASVDEEGDGSTSWTTSLIGDPAFVLPQDAFLTCQANSPTVARVQLLVPPGAVPGDAFDAVVTVHASDGSFADGQVHVHADVTAPMFDLQPTSIDFGDVLPDQGATRMLTIVDHDAVPVNITAQLVTAVDTPPPFGYGPDLARGIMNNTRQWLVSFVGRDVGDYSTTLEFSAGASTPSQCQTKKSLALHARVVAPDGGAPDGGARDATADAD